MRIRGALGVALASALTVVGLPWSADATAGQAPLGAPRPIVYVGNNWDGTVDLVDPGSFTRLARLNVIPDKDQRMVEIMASPDRLAYFLAIRELIGEGHDQFVDDMYSTNDGKFLIVSRPSFADVVKISLSTRQIVWRFKVDGYRADHMAISPDGLKVAVSASTGNVVHVLRTSDGAQLVKFPSGDSPHENVSSTAARRSCTRASAWSTARSTSRRSTPPSRYGSSRSPMSRPARSCAPSTSARRWTTAA